MKFTRLFLTLVLLLMLIPSFASPSQAGVGNDAGLIMRGAAKTVGSAFAIPVSMLQYSTRAFPLGLVAGAVVGSFKTVGGTLSGVFDMARGAAPYAKYAAFL